MIIGFSGTRKGMRDSQRLAVFEYLSQKTVTALHHGDCVGADSQAHDLALGLGIPIYVHPPQARRFRAFRGGIHQYEPKRYHDRNHDIVDACDVLIATPLEVYKQTGGTWETIHYAKDQGKRVVIFS